MCFLPLQYDIVFLQINATFCAKNSSKMFKMYFSTKYKREKMRFINKTC